MNLDSVDYPWSSTVNTSLNLQSTNANVPHSLLCYQDILYLLFHGHSLQQCLNNFHVFPILTTPSILRTSSRPSFLVSSILNLKIKSGYNHSFLYHQTNANNSKVSFKRQS